MFRRQIAICALTLSSALTSAAPGTPPERTLAISHVNVIDVVEGRIIPNSTVTIRGMTITSVMQNGSVPADATVIDGRGKFLVPGLWDMHSHVGGGTSLTAWHAAWLKLYVANGVTGIRDMGSDLDLILEMRAATAARRVLGPRIFTAGPILDDAPGDWPLRMRVKTAQDGTAAVQLLKQRGVDLIKVHDHTPHEAFYAIAKEARHQGLPLAGHVPLGLTVEQVIDAGQGDIEHLSNLQLWKPCSGGKQYRPDACRPFFEMLARRGIWQTPTLVAMSEVATLGTPASRVSADELAYASKSLKNGWAANQRAFSPTPEIIEELRTGAEVGAVVTKDMADSGVGILAGCDMMIAGFCVYDELVAMVRGGMSPLAALRTATLNPARYFGIQQTAGSVAPGKRADLVLLDANPLTDITNLRRITAIVVAGRFLNRKVLDELIAEVKTAAEQT